MPLLTRRTTLDLLRRHGARPRTSLGQHFLVDPNTIRKIVRLAGVHPGDHVLEIGAGLGALTVALAEAGAHVVAVEQDRAMRGPLLETTESVRQRVRVVWGNALEIDYGRVLRGASWTMVSNLPYNIATPLLIDLLVERRSIERYVVMVQREVGLRLVAGPGDDEYGGVSVKVAYLAEASLVSKISRRVFLPEPAVESVMIELRRRTTPPVQVSRARLFAVIDAAFAQRRKTIRNALRGAGIDAPLVERALDAAGVEAGARAEELPLEAFAALAARLKVPATR
ncbi:MAG: 16S rRNA (adenine(1518)-N(6)/adenine(1519)-N(6))-dimethyltransferase RsmA [Actinomycetota bacterium]|nr:16S rRNA (adenine(1518)-N(6)/adenine(1519)-N(6))-dimethyltransferase RsmA [Actinomycetota bacterium]